MPIHHSFALDVGVDNRSSNFQTRRRCGLLPSFFVIGPPRTGTTWLHEILGRHAILPSPTKETRFLDQHFHRGMDWYLAHFPSASEPRPIGEVAPTYFASAVARERMARILPRARVVCIFRNPVERVFSLYRLKRAYGMVPWNFDDAVVNDPELLESGRYATHLKEWFRLLGKDQVLATFYEDLKDNPQDYVDKLADFICLPRFDITGEQTRIIHGGDEMTHPRHYRLTRAASGMADWLKARQLDGIVASFKRSRLINLVLGGGPRFEELSQEAADRLYELFRPEIEELEVLLDRDLSAWKSHWLQPQLAVSN